MHENKIQLLGAVIKVNLVYESPDGMLTSFYGVDAESPLMQSDSLRSALRKGISAQSAPFMYKADHKCYYAALHAGDGILFMGPMCHEKLRKIELRQMYREFGVDGEDLPELPAFTLPEMRNMVLLTDLILENEPPENEELLHLNQLITGGVESEKADQTRFLLKEEEENDADAMRHSYREEQTLMQAVREGRAKDAVRIAEQLDLDSGRLSEVGVRHRRNLGIIGISLCARAAIEGGLAPETAYRISGYYIQKCDAAQTETYLLQLRNSAIKDMTDRVAEKLNRPRSSNYVEQSRDYVRKHYREKIYLEDVAEALKISPTYLSRLFKRETGQNFQDYINEVRVDRAANLLKYSEMSLSEISQYVNFPNQSYFGKIFKKYKNMTPRAYRDSNKPAEFKE